MQQWFWQKKNTKKLRTNCNQMIRSRIVEIIWRGLQVSRCRSLGDLELQAWQPSSARKACVLQHMGQQREEFSLFFHTIQFIVNNEFMMWSSRGFIHLFCSLHLIPLAANTKVVKHDAKKNYKILMVQPSKHKSEITKRIDETSAGFSALRLLELNILLIYPRLMINLQCLFPTKTCIFVCADYVPSFIKQGCERKHQYLFCGV